MQEEKSCAEMRLLMMQIAEVEKNAPPAYPDYKRGILTGVIALAVVLGCGFLLSFGENNWFPIVWKSSIVIGIVAFCWGAFRPKR